MLIALFWQNSIHTKKYLKKYNLFFLNFYKNFFFFYKKPMMWSFLLPHNKTKVVFQKILIKKILFSNIFLK